MSAKRYPQEFKIKAIKQITEKGYSLVKVTRRVGVAGLSSAHPKTRTWETVYSLDYKSRSISFIKRIL